MVVGSFVSIKGGVGKTHILICAANCLAACGYRVLVIDTDLNNSLSFYYLDDEGFKQSKILNIANALSNEENKLGAYAIKTRRERVDLIASTPYLSDLRTINERRLSRMTGSLEGSYDIVLIDCHPTYDNIVLNAINASDYVITPVLQDTFSYNGAEFMRKVIARDTDKSGSWYVLMNGYNQRYIDAKGGTQKEVEELYEEGGFPLMPRSTWIPWTAAMHRIVDNKKMLTTDLLIHPREERGGYVANPTLYNAVMELSECFLDGRELERVRGF